MSAVDMTLFQVRVDEMIVDGTSGDEMNTDKLPVDEMTIDEMPVDKLTCCSLVTVVSLFIYQISELSFLRRN